MKTSLCIAIIAIFISCKETSQTTTQDGLMTESTPLEANCSDAIYQRFRKAIFKFASSSLCYLIEGYGNQTINAAPLQCFYALGVLGLHSYGEQLRQILRAMNLKNKDEISCPLLQINKFVGNSKGLLTSDIFYGNKQYKFVKTFKRDMIDIAGGDAEIEDFSKRKRAIRMVNKRIQIDTNNTISQVVTATDNLNKNTEMALISALYFEAIFKIQLNTTKKTLSPFYVTPNNSVLLQYFSQQGIFNYTNSKRLCSKVFIVPCQEPYYGVLILPNPNVDIRSVVKKIKVRDCFDSVIKSTKPTPMDISIPAYETVSTKVDTLKIFQNSLNIPLIFDSDKSQFSDLEVNNKNIALTFGANRCVFKGNFGDGIPPEIPDCQHKVRININRPFVYLIMLQDVPLIFGFRNMSLPLSSC